MSTSQPVNLLTCQPNPYLYPVTILSMHLLNVSEDILSFVTGLGLLQGILLAILVWLHPKADHTVSKFLSLYIISLSIVMSGPLLLKTIGWRYGSFVAPFPALVGPLLYFYVRSFKETITWRKAWPHLVMFVIYFIVTWWWLDHLSKNHPDAKDFPHKAFSSTTGIIFFSTRYVHLIVYYFLSLQALKIYQRSITQLFSETSRINLNWMKWLINGYILIILVSVIIYFFMTKYSANFYLLYLVNIAMATPYIYMATYKGITQPTIWQKAAKDKHSLEEQIQVVVLSGNGHHQSPKPAVQDSRVGEIANKIVALMENDKLYQEPELTLKDLADKIGYPPHQVSQAINEGMNKTFYDLVNGYRVEEAKRLLLDPQNRDYTILSVGFEAGFNSKTTFNTVFKKFTGLTPSEFKNKERAQQLSLQTK